MRLPCFPDGVELYRDSAFQGHELPGVTVHQPKKKPRGGKLSDEDKEANRLISSIRVAPDSRRAFHSRRASRITSLLLA